MHLAQNEPAKTASVRQPVNSSNSSGWQKNYQQRHCSECKVKDWREKLWCTDLDRTNLHRAGNQSHSRWGIPSVRTTLIRETHEHGRQKSEEPGRARQKPTGPLWRRNPNKKICDNTEHYGWTEIWATARSTLNRCALCADK
jgi:hypothetical protein